MTVIAQHEKDARHLLMGNEAIARGALEAGVAVAAGYPGTPSSEIIENLAAVSRERNLYVEWSTNEKVAMEVAAAAMLIVPCEDPGALSSINEGDSRHFSRMLEVPLLEPGDFQEAKDMTRWGFELSEQLKCPVMLRSVTRLSHASGSVVFGDLPQTQHQARFRHDGFILDPETGIMSSAPVEYRHGLQQKKIKQAQEIFETSPFNTYTGPAKPELLVITSSACNLYTREAVHLLGVQERVGILKLGTTWPAPGPGAAC